MERSSFFTASELNLKKEVGVVDEILATSHLLEEIESIHGKINLIHLFLGGQSLILKLDEYLQKFSEEDLNKIFNYFAIKGYSIVVDEKEPNDLKISWRMPSYKINGK